MFLIFYLNFKILNSDYECNLLIFFIFMKFFFIFEVYFILDEVVEK